MSLVNNSANNFKDFLDAIKPFLNYQFYDLSGQGVEANNFSTDEKVIGTWIDGKPLYQKVLTGNTKTEVGWKTYDTGIGAGVIDKVVFMNGCIAYSNGWTTSMGSTATGSHIMFDIKPTTGEWEVYVGDNGAGFNCPAILILRYTKTTDIAVASGEKIVGQWIDGKPVYEKVLTKTLSSYVDTQTQDIIDISGVSIDKIVKMDTTFIGVGSTKDTASIISIGGTNNSNRLYAEAVYSSGIYHIYIFNNGRKSFNGGTAYITLRYTKTA